MLVIQVCEYTTWRYFKWMGCMVYKLHSIKRLYIYIYTFIFYVYFFLRTLTFILFWYIMFLFIYLIVFIVVQVQLSPFSCHHFPPPTHLHLPSSILPKLSMGPLYMFLDDPSPSFPHFSPPLSPLVTVSLFFISMSLVIFCLLACFVD